MRVDAELRAEIDRHLETCEIAPRSRFTRNVVVLIADDRVFELPPASRSPAYPAGKRTPTDGLRLTLLMGSGRPL